MSCSRTQRSASGEARTRNPSISGQALYHDCAPQLGSILCRYDTCPTQYAPDLRGSILCMQGTQYAPRESILCMEHFVALQCTYTWASTRDFGTYRICAKAILKYPTGLEIIYLVCAFICFNTLCMQEAKALARLCVCAGSSEPSLLAEAISSYSI